MKRSSVVLALALLIGIAGIAVALSSRGGDEYVVYAKFNDASGILKNYNVKVGQVKAGAVKELTLDRDDNAVLKMVLDKEAAPIGAGASAAIRPVNLLGEHYIDLNPGDAKRPIPSGSVIPPTRTTTSVELDDLLNMLDPDTRGAMRILINEAGLAMAGRGADFNSLLQDLPPALDSARGLIRQVARENATLDRLAVRGDRVLAAIGARNGDLTKLVHNAAGALKAVGQRREQLGATVSNAPQALARLRTTLTSLRSMARALTPAAADLRATEPALASTLGRLPQFARDAHAALTTATGVAPTLSRLGRRSVPTLRRLRPAADELAAFSTDLRPFMKAADNGKGLFQFLRFVAGWTSVTGQTDGLGHIFRLRATIDPELVESALKRYSAGLTQAPRTRGKRALPLPVPLKSALGGKAPALPNVRVPKLRLPAQVSPAVDKARGDTTKLLDYLLGP